MTQTQPWDYYGILEVDDVLEGLARRESAPVAVAEQPPVEHAMPQGLEWYGPTISPMRLASRRDRAALIVRRVEQGLAPMPETFEEFYGIESD